ncbi:MAG TPA: nuclease-related domain-containing protein [Microthrixaceae bacterium]|nr:nuclease-related domain-containing protein [Microthrixaceae bacterium]
MATKVMALKRDGACSACATPLAAGTRAQWDNVAKLVTCLTCVENIAAPEVAAISTPPLPPIVDPEPTGHADDLPPIDVGRPGASAQKEFERRHAKHEQRIEEKWGAGRLGRVAKFLSDDPQSTTAWAKGAHGEERVAAILSERLAEDAVLLHDRKVPKTRGNIDHIAIAPSGVWVIDAKKYTGKVEKRDVGGFFKTDLRLYVGGRDRSKSVDGLQWQVDAVRTVLEDEAIPVHPALSFVGAEWSMFFAKPFQLKGVWISWPGKLAELVLGDGPLAIDDVDRVARLLSHRLPAN